MYSYYIVSPEIYASTDWRADAYCVVGPVLIMSGVYLGNYAVNTKIFESAACFDRFRELLQSCPTAELDLPVLNFVSDNLDD